MDGGLHLDERRGKWLQNEWAYSSTPTEREVPQHIIYIRACAV